MRQLSRLFFAGILLGSLVTPAQADFRLSAGRYTEPDDWFAGAGYRITVPFLTIIPNAEYVFTSGFTYASLNADATVGMFIVGYVGGGVGVNYLKPDGGETTTHGAVNLIGGIQLGKLPLAPFAQVKYSILSGIDDAVVLSVGIHL